MTPPEQLLRPVGAARTATALAVRTGWPIRTADIGELVAGGHLSVAGYFEGWPLYDRGEIDAVPADVVARLASRSGHGPASGRSVPPGAAIRDYAAHLAITHGLEVATVYRPHSGRWLLDWPPRPDGRPDPAGLRADLHAHPAGVYRRLVDLAPPAHRAVAAARRALAGGAVVLDTETTGLGAGAAIVEVAVVELATGAVLLDTLVSPDGVAVEPGARRRHRITDGELATAPTWPQVWPRLVAAVAGRAVLAYNAEFDRRLIRQAAARYGLPGARDWTWGCAMAWRGQAHRSRPGPLGGGHRARGDALAARQVVLDIAAIEYVPEVGSPHLGADF
ncbi:3'-5' exonuclease [Marinitenerispora sediminis]|uniref:Exonuclease domain-containing protein n=1 Tax=Marinitenerispora sediminis TaxID=1931232 RepID=A0A368T4E1_9ACTN|nr:3'-5' exonuclease [Marinitenerispora sediminis]RCV49740.1 hypothetical protein DEF28_19940 [Marinitenerispora sediminis]RCV53554.1 hypothetical protein DEF23_17290 [Marinitenerispora sediminis]RCV57652.1 hypothetical protein DEF24_14850 [Marinitenerispora sediminis]